MTRINIICILLLFCFNVSNAQWTNNQNALQVIGQPDFTTYDVGYTNSTFFHPTEIVLDIVKGKAYIVDSYNHRVLRFAYPFSGSPITSEMQFGTGTDLIEQNSFTYPLGAAVYNDVLYILDSGHRILRFNNASEKSDQPYADGIIGQTDYTLGTVGTSSTKFDSPQFIYIDENGNLWVPDQNNNRALKFSNVNNKPTDGTAEADFVLGQMNFTTNATGTSTSSMDGPNGVCVNGTTVWVSDTRNYRVLRFDNPSTNGVAANGVLGITSQWGPTQNKFEMPYDLEIDGNGNLYVSDYNRVLIFLNASAKADGANADNLLGQSEWIAYQAGTGANGFDVYVSEGLAIDNASQKLFVADLYHNRVLGFTASSSLPVELTSFTAASKNNVVELQWKTATEKNNYGFEVERSIVSNLKSANYWEKIAFVQGHGNSNSPKEYSFTDAELLPGQYEYRLKQIDIDGSFEYSQIIEITVGSPKDFSLSQNYPNPFNPATTITYQLPKSGSVTLKIYDMLGKEVMTLVHEQKEIGRYTVQFDASSIASGMYIYQLRVNDFISTKKMLLLK